MDGQSRTCIEWMCNDEYEPGSFDLANIVSPPDHESMFHSLMNATPLGGDEGPGTPPVGAHGWSLGRRPSDSASIATPTSLVSLVRHLEVSPGENSAPPPPPSDMTSATATKMTVKVGDEAADTFADPVPAPSLTQAVSEALGAAESQQDADEVGYNLTRVTSATDLAELPSVERPNLERRPSVSCPNTPPRQRRGHRFFTPSIFYPERPADICREWRDSHPDQPDAAAPAGGAAAVPAAGVSGLPPASSLATAGGMTDPPAERKKNRNRPRPSRLRELNFLAPTSM
ncbi:uncharacterized protein LOC122384286 isoform X1 [Amphibalanus amphitrite]|uniref:uncharacterized protein LOC122384286 isoform X1 n=2 Tax=Amphibalanus amphitrite TaxID=1232801 RepID=UPI001C9195C7|nr:uncharacterized protein LOC122384286 isoform X1 [Amphibalanus amphitrite]XP_043227483.1 uncharacterized protein LOC122384286 isoform X1 [Amphibalanus amphitrite]XP_043227485.1 uncharacterized protein LOC122384286 isoform X1 [Amphibalanus amphitrite]XP_043227486.1 uncharacterized protein LOC122384286 isoform X1 [Amphibalanus amphitrite]XP_043227487.1 uncharacterized protein LOC122384286 isoform X1 [Amphibalanus amphitrite]XP_043227488.1 uncharacterized protein LOC122384286 isoform X1 [Amphib